MVFDNDRKTFKKIKTRHLEAFGTCHSLIPRQATAACIRLFLAIPLQTKKKKGVTAFQLETEKETSNVHWNSISQTKKKRKPAINHHDRENMEDVGRRERRGMWLPAFLG